MIRLKMVAISLVVAAGCAQAGEKSVPVTTGKIHAVDGVRVTYDVRGKGDAALVFIHGWACDRSFWREQLDLFARRHCVVALDLGGHGDSGANRELWSTAAFGGDVQAVVDELDLDKVVLIGHSLGGAVALEAARLMPRRVVGIVGVDTLHDAEIEYTRDMTQQAVESFKADFQATMTSFVRSAFVESADPNLIEWVASKACSANQEAAVATILEMPNLDIKKSFQAAKVPIRCINARPFPPNNLKTKVETNRKYSDFDVVLMQGVGHFPMLEKPEEFNGHLRGILSRMISP
ncbi:MAG: alpha/beta fold hydrolase [Planctomycetota bacterium]